MVGDNRSTEIGKFKNMFKSYPAATIVAMLISGALAILIGFLELIAKGIESGVVLGWQLDIVGVTDPSPGILQYLAITMIAVLASAPYLYSCVLHTPSKGTILSILVVALTLLVIIVWAVVTSMGLNQSVTPVEINQAPEQTEILILMILRAAGLSPATHFLTGLFMLLFLLGKAKRSKLG